MGNGYIETHVATSIEEWETINLLVHQGSNDGVSEYMSVMIKCVEIWKKSISSHQSLA